METRNLTVNFHITRYCNYQCRYCFHRGMNDNTTMPKEKWFKIIDNISSSNIVKRINISGGEPFTSPGLTKHIVHYAKNKGFETSIITNSSLLTNKIFNDIKNDVDMIGISVDSGNDDINYKIGRCSRDHYENEPTHLENVLRVAQLCKQNNIYLKFNSVICRENLNDNSIFDLINKVQPQRWKAFRVLQIDNENGIDKDLRTPYNGFITDEEWINWKKECEKKCSIIPKYENNDEMINSYIIVDEDGFLLDSSSGSKQRKGNLLDSDFKEIMKKVMFDEEKFFSRGGSFIIHQNTDIEDI